MARSPDERIKEAHDLYKKGIKLVEIASQLNLPAGTVRRWKSTHKWDNERSDSETNVRKRKRGAPKGNKNALNNSGGAPEQNKNAEKYGLFSKYLPPETLEIVKSIDEKQPIDIIWEQIQLQYAAIIRAQRIAYVKDQQDKTIEPTGVRQAWDKHNNFIQAQSRAMTALNSLIRQYDEMLHRSIELATEEQKTRIAKLKAEINNLEPNKDKDGTKYNGIPSIMIAPAFASTVFDIKNRQHMEYVFPGGRGSTKSSFVSLQIIDLLMQNETMHACVMRQVADTLRTSVYQQMLWAIDALGLDDEFHGTVSPLEITRVSTGQKIYFRGADDPGKIKSIKVPFGYIGIAWFEELDQFGGQEAVRKIEQSVIRGGDIAYIFKSFNPPKSANNWANKYIKIPKETRLVVESNYTQVPPEWLGKPFLDEAEFLKEVNPEAYENEYMGVANGAGGSVFDNVFIEQITDEQIKQFDHVLNGVDWGWYPDLFAFSRCHYEPSQHTLYIWQEYTCNKQSNQQTADKLIELGITSNDIITCDSAENKSIGDYKMYGLLARGAEKGPGSREYSYKWLQSLRKIVIDNARCPIAAEEFLNYEYERDKEGNVLSGYPDGNDHVIDSIRYATNQIWKKRGQ